jgi:hypothetical protein
MRLPNKGLLCIERDCKQPALAKQLCKRHYSRDVYWRRQGVLTVEIVEPIDLAKLPVESIGQLRNDGASYTAIAQQLKLSKREVQEVCRKMGWVIM